MIKALPKYLPIGYYNDPDVLIREINLILKQQMEGKAETPTQLELDPLSRKVIINMGVMKESGKMIWPYFVPEMRQMLGLHPDYIGKGFLRGMCPVNLNASYEGLYMYCDVIESGIVGDIEGKVLRRLKVPASPFGSEVVVAFEKPIYLPIEKNEFDTIDILICNDIGEKVAFRYGRSTAVLHIRPRS